MSDLICPHCGWKYDPKAFARPGDDGQFYVLVPAHVWWTTHEGVNVECPGTGQHSRNSETDRRLLWKDLPPKGSKP